MFSLFLSEFLGTLILIFLGNAVVANVLLKDSKGNGSGWIVITSGWAFAIAIACYAVGGISGAHMNPAFSIALAVIGLLPFDKLPVYIAGQFLGAACGSLLVYLSYKQHYDKTEDPGLILATFCTGPAIRNKFWNMVTEIIATATIVFVILVVTVFNKFADGFAYYMVGIIVWSIGLSLGGPTGYAINPARDLAPRFIHGLLPIPNKGTSDWDYAIVPLVGPIVGAIIGALLFLVCKGIFM